MHLPSDFDFKEDAIQDREQMFIKLKMLQDNVLIAIKKLKGSQSVDKLPSNLQIAWGQIKLDPWIRLNYANYRSNIFSFDICLLFITLITLKKNSYHMLMQPFYYHFPL